MASREAALPVARFYGGRDAAAATTTQKHVLLGVMSNPSNDVLRTGIRNWSAHFRAHRTAVDVRFVYGTSFHNSSAAPAAALASIGPERAEHDDFFFVDGREKLPHVGVVTEKSAAWWRTVAVRMPGYRYYCKSDDDTLVHLDHLAALVDELEAALPGRPVYLGHTKWRAWNVDYRFQACGGGWGAAKKTANDLRQTDDCPHAAGPYPYMSGGFVCMSRPLALLMAQDEAFGHFLEVARSRNTHGRRATAPAPLRRPRPCRARPRPRPAAHARAVSAGAGTRCRHPMECAGQPWAEHMWHRSWWQPGLASGWPPPRTHRPVGAPGGSNRAGRSDAAGGRRLATQRAAALTSAARAG